MRKGKTGRGRTKEAREIERSVIKLGGTVERTGKGHLKIKGPLGMCIVPSDPANNAMRTTLRTIETKAGLRLMDSES